jgi:hypothetical protein
MMDVIQNRSSCIDHHEPMRGWEGMEILTKSGIAGLNRLVFKSSDKKKCYYADFTDLDDCRVTALLSCDWMCCPFRFQYRAIHATSSKLDVGSHEFSDVGRFFHFTRYFLAPIDPE